MFFNRWKECLISDYGNAKKALSYFVYLNNYIEQIKYLIKNTLWLNVGKNYKYIILIFSVKYNLDQHLIPNPSY